MMPRYLFKLTQKQPEEMLIKAPNLRVARLMVLDKFTKKPKKDSDYAIELRLVSQKKLQQRQFDK
jgi:hypothetical protein|tara:strand:+ start:492 stop:686 length:195 start_codon:yes stop_codon:yes gene_type:complete